jgi:hypothetical protein
LNSPPCRDDDDDNDDDDNDDDDDDDNDDDHHHHDSQYHSRIPTHTRRERWPMTGAAATTDTTTTSIRPCSDRRADRRQHLPWWPRRAEQADDAK